MMYQNLPLDLSNHTLPYSKTLRKHRDFKKKVEYADDVIKEEDEDEGRDLHTARSASVDNDFFLFRLWYGLLTRKFLGPVNFSVRGYLKWIPWRRHSYKSASFIKWKT